MMQGKEKERLASRVVLPPFERVSVVIGVLVVEAVMRASAQVVQRA